jgi:predicted HAD superfamily Cof-like phosphohydrolase
MIAYPRAKSEHYQNVLRFMLGAGQVDGAAFCCGPALPQSEVRLLRARLIYEEAMETINALGVVVQVDTAWGATRLNQPEPVWGLTPVTVIDAGHGADLTKVVDGCCDVMVVTTGTLIACGVTDRSALDEVDRSNLAKLDGDIRRREDGKVLKPPGWQPPDLKAVLRRQQQTCDEIRGLTGD